MNNERLAGELLKTARELLAAGDINIDDLDTLMKKYRFKKKPQRGDLAYYEWESRDTFIYAGVSERKPGMIYIAAEDYNNPYQNPFEHTELKNTDDLARFLSRNKKAFK